jgi:hypothetical protein
LSRYWAILEIFFCFFCLSRLGFSINTDYCKFKIGFWLGRLLILNGRFSSVLFSSVIFSKRPIVCEFFLMFLVMD